MKAKACPQELEEIRKKNFTNCLDNHEQSLTWFVIISNSQNSFRNNKRNSSVQFSSVQSLSRGVKIPWTEEATVHGVPKSRA